LLSIASKLVFCWQGIAVQAQSDEWRSKRESWVEECQDSSNHSVSHFASCLWAVEGSLKAAAQNGLWLMLRRDDFKQACVAMGARDLSLQRRSAGGGDLERLALAAMMNNMFRGLG
jgi:hypothetical protein